MKKYNHIAELCMDSVGALGYTPRASLTIVLTTYNRAEQAADTLRKLVNERPTSIIVIDDCSTDETQGMLKDFCNSAFFKIPIKVVRNSVNKGVVASLNIALELIETELVYFAADDDTIATGGLNQMRNALTNHPQAGLCFSNPSSFTIKWDNPTIRKNPLALSKAPRYFSPSELLDISKKKPLLITGLSMFRTSKLKEIGGFNPCLKWHSDWFAANQIAFKDGAYYIPATITAWRRNEGGYLNSRTKSTQLEVVSLIAKQLTEDMKLAGIGFIIPLASYFKEFRSLTFWKWTIARKILGR